MIPPRKSLTEILGGSANADKLKATWETTKAAAERVPIPAGEYVALVAKGELIESTTKKTPGYKLEFKIIEGEHAGARCWHDAWLTEAALSFTKKDLAKLGITTMGQLDRPLPAGMVVKLKVVLRKEDDGTERNSVRSFELLRIEEPKPDPFAPDGATDNPPTGEPATEKPF